MGTKGNNKQSRSTGFTRRQFIGTGALGAAGLLSQTGCATTGPTAPSVKRGTRPNFIFIHTDQQGLDTLSAYGCPGVATPNMDRLATRGTSFMESYTAAPVCSPARTSWFTGRTTSEHGVVVNGLPMLSSLPDLGDWLRRDGYETFYVGKWHIPRNVDDSFHVLHRGTGQGEHSDSAVARAVQAFLLNRRSPEPFFLSAGFLQPHDICYWLWQHHADPDELRYAEIADQLPELPPSFTFDPREPKGVAMSRRCPSTPGVPLWSERQWQYYLWSYYRHVEMVDTHIGRILDALEDSSHASNTVLILSSDHGEGRARHQLVLKNRLYDECAKVPMIVSWPGEMAANVRDTAHLVSGLDLVPTVCDYAGIKPPPAVRGRSLRPALEGRQTEWREFVATQAGLSGHVVRTLEYKYIVYKGDPTEQLFDMQNDPWETKNLAPEPKYAGVLLDHQRLLEEWESTLDIIREPSDEWLEKFRQIRSQWRKVAENAQQATPVAQGRGK